MASRNTRPNPSCWLVDTKMSAAASARYFWASLNGPEDGRAQPHRRLPPHSAARPVSGPSPTTTRCVSARPQRQGRGRAAKAALARDQPSDSDHDECVRRNTQLLTRSARDGRGSFDAKRNERYGAPDAIDLRHMAHRIAGTDRRLHLRRSACNGSAHAATRAGAGSSACLGRRDPRRLTDKTFGMPLTRARNCRPGPKHYEMRVDDVEAPRTQQPSPRATPLGRNAIMEGKFATASCRLKNTGARMMLTSPQHLRARAPAPAK